MKKDFSPPSRKALGCSKKLIIKAFECSKNLISKGLQCKEEVGMKSITLIKLHNSTCRFLTTHFTTQLK